MMMQVRKLYTMKGIYRNWRNLFTERSMRPYRSIVSTFTTNIMESDKIPSHRNVYVQVLPVVRVVKKGHKELSEPATSISEIEKRKILLCKWASGDFKNRYTGLIKTLIGHTSEIAQSERNNREKRGEILVQAAKELLPLHLQPFLANLDLVGLLSFEDPPPCNEYIYIANLILDERHPIDFNEVVPFNENSCYWYDWENIPFQEMPDDDALWYPRVLWGKKKVKGSFTFGSWKDKSIKSYELYDVNEIE